MKQLHLSQLQQRYGGHFIALWKGKVIASALTNAALMKKVLPLLHQRRLEFLFVPPKGMMCVY